VAQQKQITSLEREVASLRKQLERRSGGASAEEVVAVADAVASRQLPPRGGNTPSSPATPFPPSPRRFERMASRCRWTIS
jgi:hypothetical protein